jgi:acyl-CoA synthetase (AMP-forming)/AMP-acid ligase II
VSAGAVTGLSPVEGLIRRAVGDHDPALIADGHEIRLSRIHDAARGVAARLVSDGVEPGDRVFLMMRNSAEWLAAALGSWYAGALLVPINTRFTTAEITGLFAAGAPRAWIADDDLAPVIGAAEGTHAVDVRYSVTADADAPLRDILDWGRTVDDGPVVDVAPDDIAAVFFTAGTTGAPKGALTSHSAISTFADVVEKSTFMSSTDTVIVPMPMFYTGGIKATLANLLIGARVVTFRKWSPSDLVEVIDEFDASFLWAVSSVWALMLHSKTFDAARVQSLRAVWRTGSYTPKPLLEGLIETFAGCPHYHSYGLTECNLASMENDALRYEHSCGFPTAGVELTIDGHRSSDEVGEILLRGRQQFSGYLGNPEQTAATLQDGWVHTGDQGRLDADGRLHVLGRGSEIIIRGGENISAVEVERTLLEQQEVFEAAVVGVEDDLFGHELKAVVVPTHGATVDSEELRERCREVLAEYKVPKFIEIRHEPLPRSPSGKIAKSEL